MMVLRISENQRLMFDIDISLIKYCYSTWRHGYLLRFWYLTGNKYPYRCNCCYNSCHIFLQYRLSLKVTFCPLNFKAVSIGILFRDTKEFRPDFGHLPDLRSPFDVPVILMTATATPVLTNQCQSLASVMWFKWRSCQTCMLTWIYIHIVPVFVSPYTF